MQGLLFDLPIAAPGKPEGLIHHPDFLDEGEENALLAESKKLHFRPFEFQGFVGKRRTVSYGWNYRFDGSGLARADPIPEWLLPVRGKAAALAGREPEAFEHVLLIEYGPGAGIGWHRDRPVFDDVVGVSLLSSVALRFRRQRPKGWDRFTIQAEPRSAYLLRGPARDEWEHSIAPVETLRYSITFRTMREPQDTP